MRRCNFHSKLTFIPRSYDYDNEYNDKFNWLPDKEPNEKPNDEPDKVSNQGYTDA